MKTVLVISYFIIITVCWMLGAGGKISGSGDGVGGDSGSTKSFILRSVFFWVAVILSLCVGFFLNG